MLHRIGAIGDIHAEDEILERALAHLEARAVDKILGVGDVADGPGDLGRCCRLLEQHGVEVVRGNHDRWALTDALRSLPGAKAALEPDERRYLESLPVTRSYETPSGALLLCHGLDGDDMAGVRPDDFGYGLDNNDALWALVHAGEYRHVVNGHTHHRMVRRFDELTVINAGTLFREHDPCFAEIDFDAGLVVFFDALDQGREIRASAPCPL